MNRWMRKVFGCANPNTSKGEYFNANALHWTDAELDKDAKDVSDYLKTHDVKGIYSAVARKAGFGATGHCDLTHIQHSYMLNVDSTILFRPYLDRPFPGRRCLF